MGQKLCARRGEYRSVAVQGEFDPSKKSGVGVDFEHLVNSLPGPNKDRARKPSLI